MKNIDYQAVLDKKAEATTLQDEWLRAQYKHNLVFRAAFDSALEEVGEEVEGDKTKEKTKEEWLNYLAGNPLIRGHGGALDLIGQGNWETVFTAFRQSANGVYA